MKKIGLIINPIAGMGGKVGLKGTDGDQILDKAIKLGASKESPEKAKKALQIINESLDEFVLYTYPYEMGQIEAEQVGIKNINILGNCDNNKTSYVDTLNAAKDMIEAGVDLLMFAGGDGTARDIFSIIRNKIPVIGIPTGVKIHSAVFATNAINAGRIVLEYFKGCRDDLIEAEVMDIDEEKFRQGMVTAKLYGYMNIPNDRKHTQSKKFSGNISDKTLLRGMAKYVVDEMEDDILYIIGSGSTTKEIMDILGLDNTLLGIDVIKNKKLILKDATERDILDITSSNKFMIVVSIIGGQGYIFGRGNQQLSPNVLKRCGKDSIIIVSSLQKLISLEGRPLLVDTGDDECDSMLKGVYKVIVGYGEIYAYYC